MRRLSFLRTIVLLAAVTTGAASCNDTTGTYARLTFRGSVSPVAPIRRIEVDLRLGERPATTEFEAPNQGMLR